MKLQLRKDSPGESMTNRATLFARPAPVLVLTATLLFSFAPSVAAQTASPSGSFGFLLGVSYAHPDSDNGAAMLGLANFDGAGNVTGSYHLELGSNSSQATLS